MATLTPHQPNFQLQVLQTRPLTVDQAPVLARALAFLGSQLLPLSAYQFRIHKGSLTLQSAAFPHDVVKLFFDEDGELPGSDADQLVLGLELTAHKPLAQTAQRDLLRQTFGARYLDPRESSGTIYQLAPTHPGHAYDVVLLDEEVEWDPKDTHPIGPDEIQRLENEIRRAVEAGFPNHEPADIDWPAEWKEYDRRSCL